MRYLVYGVLVLIGVGMVSCGEDTSTGVEMVTITGTVFDIDTLDPAEDVRVWLLDTAHSGPVATGSDGAFIIEIPKGSSVMLVTDDFDNTVTNRWLPLINVEYPPIVANESYMNWVIHACPNSVGMEKGSVACWDNYLANGDAGNDDVFVPTATGGAGGTVVAQYLGCENGQFSLSSRDFRLTIDEPEFPEGYVIGEKFYGPGFVPDPTLGPDMMYPGDRSATDDYGMFLSFGHPRFAGSEVTVTVTDIDPARGFDWVTPLKVPVRQGWVSMILPCWIDGNPNVPVREWFGAGCY